MAVTVLGNTQIINSGSTTPIELPVTDLPIPNVVVLDEVTLINTNGGGVTNVVGGIIRISDLSSGDGIIANQFYEYNDVIYRAVTNHIYNGTFNSSNFIPQGARLEVQTFTITNNSTTTLTLSTSNVGRVLKLTVNGLEYLEGIDFTKGGSGNKTITFTEALPWDADYSPTYVQVDVIPDDSVSWGTGGGGSGTSDHALMTHLAYAESGHTGFEPAKGLDDNYVTDIEKANLHAPESDNQDLSGYQLTTEKGDANGYAGLDSNSRLAEINSSQHEIGWALDSQVSDTTIGTKITDYIPYNYTVSSIVVTLKTAPSGSTVFTIDIKKNGTSVFSTKITFDSGEVTTLTASNPYVLSTSPLVFLANDKIEIVIDYVGSTVAGIGPILKMIGYKN